MNIKQINRLFEVVDLNNIKYIDSLYQDLDKKKLISELEDVREEALIEHSKSVLHDTYIQFKAQWYDTVNRALVLLNTTKAVHEMASGLLVDAPPYANIKHLNVLTRYYESFSKFVEGNDTVHVFIRGGYKTALEKIKEDAISAISFDDPPYECGISKTYDFECNMRKILTECVTNYELEPDKVIHQYEGVICQAMKYVEEKE